MHAPNCKTVNLFLVRFISGSNKCVLKEPNSVFMDFISKTEIIIILSSILATIIRPELTLKLKTTTTVAS